MKKGSTRIVNGGPFVLALIIALFAAILFGPVVYAEGGGGPEPPENPPPPDTTVTSAPEEPTPERQEADASMSGGVSLLKIMELLALGISK